MWLIVARRSSGEQSLGIEDVDLKRDIDEMYVSLSLYFASKRFEAGILKMQELPKDSIYNPVRIFFSEDDFIDTVEERVNETT